MPFIFLVQPSLSIVLAGLACDKINSTYRNFAIEAFNCMAKNMGHKTLCNIAVVGHFDVGKSSLISNVLGRAQKKDPNKEHAEHPIQYALSDPENTKVMLWELFGYSVQVIPKFWTQVKVRGVLCSLIN